MYSPSRGVSLLGIMLLAGILAGCQDARMTGPERQGKLEPKAEQSAASRAALATGEAGGEIPAWISGLSAGKQRGVSGAEGIALPPQIESMLGATLSPGFTRSETPPQIEIRDVRLGKDALSVDRPDQLSRQPGAESHTAWRVNPGVNGKLSILRGDDRCDDPTVIIPPPECDPDYGNPSLPPPSDSTSLPPPGPEPWYFQGGSRVIPWGFGDYIDFRSFTYASKSIAYISVTGYSFIDGWPVASGHDWASPGNMVGAGWTYDAWWNGYARHYEQLGVHRVVDTGPHYLDGVFDFTFETGDFYYSF